MALEIGVILDGKVTSVTKFGAFVALPTGQTGMVHISEIAHTYVNDVSDHLAQGQEVKVRVLSVDKDGRISLSIKKATPPPDPRYGARAGRATRQSGTVDSQGVSGADRSFEEKLKQFMQDSQSKMSDLSTPDRRMPRRGGRR